MSSKKPIVTSGYEVDSKKLAIVEKKIRTLLRMEFGTDAEGGANVEFILVDRQRYWGLRFKPVPYDFKDDEDGELVAGSEAQMEGIVRALKVAEWNLSVAHSVFATQFSLWRDHR